MKIFSSFLLLAGFVAVFTQPSHRSQAADKQDNTVRPNSNLELSITPVSATYCPGDADLDALALELKLKFTNLGSEPLILYKGSEMISRLVISRSREDAVAKRFEVNATLTYVTNAGNTGIDAPEPGKLFVILNGGDSFETTTTVSVFAVRDNARHISGAVSSGEHVLQIGVSTWPESTFLAIKLFDRWRPFGRLWYEPVLSEPMQFDVAKSPKLVDCP